MSGRSLSNKTTLKLNFIHSALYISLFEVKSTSKTYHVSTALAVIFVKMHGNRYYTIMAQLQYQPTQNKTKKQEDALAKTTLNYSYCHVTIKYYRKRDE